ncbi:MAG: phosphatase PAP2 family protein [Moraxellaceae bacterium]|nr:MAG: phosphatase PAP2 family protein [Moraxellaceae bacterium]
MAHYQKNYVQDRKPLLYLVVAVAGNSLIINFFKAALAVPCPWEFARYGGNLNYHNVIEQVFLRNGSGCFPAGQASAGYAWIALYFFGLCYQSSKRWLGLSSAIIAGAVLGGAQQLRGAHFISHDLWTLGLCWFFSLSLYCVMFKKQTFKYTMHVAQANY